MKVKEIMVSKSLHYCSPETKLHNAAKAMKNANCGALPVVDKQKKVVGLVTDRDICMSLAYRQPKPLSKRNVGDVISSKVVTVKQDDDLSTALKQMRTHQIGRLPVTDKQGKLKGILSMHNLLAESFSRNERLDEYSSQGENLAKTIKSLTDRYTMSPKSQPVLKEKSAFAVRTH